MKEFSTFEEISSAYPIGTILEYTKPHIQYGYYFNDADLKSYRLQYAKVVPLNDEEVILITKPQPSSIVEGYIYDEKFWHCAYETWDGWQTF